MQSQTKALRTRARVCAGQASKHGFLMITFSTLAAFSPSLLPERDRGRGKQSRISPNPYNNLYHRIGKEVIRLHTFDNDEVGYLRWVRANPSGFVINVPKDFRNIPYFLHRASCKHITTPKHKNYTTTQFMKICSVNRQELVKWGAGYPGNFQECSHCKP